MANGRIADGAGRLVTRGLLAVLVFALWGAAAYAQSFAETNQKALEAFNAGDLDAALSLTLEVTEASEAAAQGQKDAYLTALNNLTFLRSEEESTHVADRAVTFAAANRLLDSGQGMTALANAAAAHASLGDADRSTMLRIQMLELARGTPLHGQIVSGAVDLAFQNRDYAALRALIEEMIDVTGGYFAQTTIDALFAKQKTLEAEGDAEAVSMLVDARILLVSVVAPDQLEEFSHNALWVKFFMNYEAENFDKAADALRVWASTGSLSAEESDYLSSQAEGSLLLAQLGGYDEDAGKKLGYARLALAFAEIAYDPQDLRIGLALREVADAQAALGQYANAAETLQDAIQNLTLTAEGQLHVFLLLEDLATNAWQRGDLEQSNQLFQQAETAYEVALGAGAEPLSDLDQSILSLNRSKLQTERHAYDAAAQYLKAARSSFAAFVQSGDAKPNDLWQEVQIAQAEALLAAGNGTKAQAIEAALVLAATARDRLPEMHPTRARTLANAADQLFVAGRPDTARALLLEAKGIAEQSLPERAPLRTEIAVKLGLDALAQGDLAKVIENYRPVVRARQAPENRSNLNEAATDFEFYAWALLAQANPSGNDIDEALAAIQWTQTGQSAEAYAMMAERMSLKNPAIAALIKDEQDAVAALTSNRSALTHAFAAGQDTRDLLARQERLRETLDAADIALAAQGTELLGQGQISPMGLAEIQERLAEDEVLVTFLLPSLSPEMVEGLSTSSNLAIAIRSDGFALSVIPEISRGALNDNIDAFRCEMAISDAQCSVQATDALRGSMSLEAAPQAQVPFDWTIPHKLYTDLFSGIEEQMRAEDRVIIVPPGDLLRLPFQALITEAQPSFDLSSADWFIRKYAVSILPSFAAFKALRSTAAVKSDELHYLGIGDPVIGSAPDLDCSDMSFAALRSAGGGRANLYDDAPVDGVRLANVDQLRELTRLPDTTCELQAIRDAVGTNNSELLTRDRATEVELKRLSASGELEAFDLLVFATHGLVSGETSAVAPGLVMTPPEKGDVHDDGLLTAAEVANLSMAARLVILSACNTAAGRKAGEEGLSGLASGFFHAGAQSLMVTHWAVYSDASALVSSRLARSIAEDHDRPIAGAFRDVVLGILDDPNSTARTQHPAYWAPFTIVGI